MKEGSKDRFLRTLLVFCWIILDLWINFWRTDIFITLSFTTHELGFLLLKSSLLSLNNML